MYRQNQKLVDLLQPVIEAMGYELLGVEQGNKGGSEVLRIYIDCEGGIRVEDCERVSDQVSGVLDVEDPIKANYNLEVSSPGLDRPLFTVAQFAQHAGAEANVKLRQAIGNRRRLRGIIEKVENDTIVMQVDGEQIAVNPEQVEHARLIPVYD